MALHTGPALNMGLKNSSYGVWCVGPKLFLWNDLVSNTLQWSLELETNIYKDWNFTVTLKDLTRAFT